MGDRYIASILERCLVIGSIIYLESDIHCATLPNMGSDHWPIELMWSGLGSQFKKLFRFEHFWLEHLEFDEKIRAWREELSEEDEPSMYKFQQKLKGLKAKIKR